jgi:hypothetical protein
VTKEKYVFLGGHRKCGTTMLLNLFDEHKQCCVYPTDLTVLYGYFPMFTSNAYSAKERLARLDVVIFQTLKRFQKQFALSDILSVEQMREHFFDHLDHAALDQIATIIRQIITSYRFVTNQPVDEKPYVVVKETSLEIYAQELATAFPESKFIPLLRDPRDNYGALRAGVDKHYSKFGENEKHILASLIHRVGLSLRLMEANAQALGDQRFRPIPFERLTADAPNEMRGVAGYVGIDWNDCLVRPSVMGRETTGNNYDNEKFRDVSSKNVGRWRERISDFEAMVIEFHLREFMEKQGYPLAFPLLESARAASEFYKWTNTQYFYKDSFAVL